MAVSAKERLKELGIVLPAVPIYRQQRQVICCLLQDRFQGSMVL